MYAAHHQASGAALVGHVQIPQWEQPSWPSSEQLAPSWQAAPRQHPRHPGIRRPHQLPLDWPQVAITCLTSDTGDSLRETETHLSRGSPSGLLTACRLLIGGLCLVSLDFVLYICMVRGQHQGNMDWCEPGGDHDRGSLDSMGEARPEPMQRSGPCPFLQAPFQEFLP